MRNRLAYSVPHLSALLAQLETSTSWDEAFDQYWRSSTGRPRPVLPPPDGRTNWTWLTDLEATNRAVDFGSAFGEVAATLRLEFPEVLYVGRDNLHGAVVSRRMSSDSGVAVHLLDEAPNVGSSDIAIFTAVNGWQDRLPGWISDVEELPVHAKRLLRPGGWFGLLLPNPAWDFRFIKRTSPALPFRSLSMVRRIRRGLRNAGFVEVREYFAAHDVDIPQLYIPRRSTAVVAFHQATHVGGSRDWLARRGVSAPLFPVLLLLARA